MVTTRSEATKSANQLDFLFEEAYTFFKKLPDPLFESCKDFVHLQDGEHRWLKERFIRPLAFPMIQLPFWLWRSYQSREPLTISSEEPAFRASLGMLYLYLYLRIQDDALDEPESFNSDYLILGNEFISESFRQYQSLFPVESPFWDFFHRYWRETSRWILWDKQEHTKKVKSYSMADLIRVGKKMWVVNIPLAAVCFKANQDKDLPLIEEAMLPLLIGTQLLGDVLGLERDLKGGLITYLATQLLDKYPGPLTGRDYIQAAYLESLKTSKIEQTLEMAVKQNEIAISIFKKLKFEELISHTEECNKQINNLKENLIKAKVNFLNQHAL